MAMPQDPSIKWVLFWKTRRRAMGGPIGTSVAMAKLSPLICCVSKSAQRCANAQTRAFYQKLSYHLCLRLFAKHHLMPHPLWWGFFYSMGSLVLCLIIGRPIRNFVAINLPPAPLFWEEPKKLSLYRAVTGSRACQYSSDAPCKNVNTAP